MKVLFRALGSLVAVAATVTGFASLDYGVAGGGSGVQPLAALALAAAAFTLLKASELWS